MHAAAAGQTLDVCKVLMERTNLQLSGPAAKAADVSEGGLPLIQVALIEVLGIELVNRVPFVTMLVPSGSYCSLAK